MSKESSSNLFHFEGSFYTLHQRLLKIKNPIHQNQEKIYHKKSAKNFANFLDQKLCDKSVIDRHEIERWVRELNQDIAQRDTHQVCSWIHPLGSEKFIVNFYNLRPDSLEEVANRAKVIPIKDNSKIVIPTFQNSYCFKLYYPAEINVSQIFKNLPLLESRIKALAEDVVGNNWLTSFPENQWQRYLFPMLDYLQGAEGQLAISKKISEFQNLNFITKLSQVKK